MASIQQTISITTGILTAQLADNAYVNVEKFAKGDGSTDDTQAFIDAIAYCVSIFEMWLALNATLQKITNSNTHYAVFSIVGSKNVQIHGRTFLGDKDTHTGTTGESGHGIKILSASDVVVENVKFLKMWGDGVLMGRDDGSSIDNTRIIIQN